jgi:hypothetical protein
LILISDKIRALGAGLPFSHRRETAQIFIS